MLESVDNSQQWGRYSFIGIHPKAEIKVKTELLHIRKVRALRRCIWKNPISYLSHIMEEHRSPTFQTNPN